ncbi:YdcF family protein [Oceanicaulis sp. MMSF_3324]|uniref:YdcF family protein n=1 Tax=Oceanicaulis sp. MMSF_3324 TaxID=3046702 RepID=UPI00273F1620|nr:YdcF family protein [Oceanicaulis sp. MMSF_3324]
MSGGRFLRLTAFILLTAFVVGFALFVRQARTFTPDPAVAGQAIVVLTGGPNRVSTAAALLDAGNGGRLLISGVNPDSPPADIAAAAGASDALFDCCVDFGLQAADTIGNAAETAAWARQHRYERIIVVTSDYHMPRALLELQAAMPDVQLVAYGVPAPAPWSGGHEARRWLVEYVKYAAVYGRERVRAL